jgi:hypothetical protein
MPRPDHDNTRQDMPQCPMVRASYSIPLFFFLSACSADTTKTPGQNGDARASTDTLVMAPDTGETHPDAASNASDSGQNPPRDASTNTPMDSGQTRIDVGPARDAAPPVRDSGFSRDAEPKDARAEDARVITTDSGVSNRDAGSSGCPCSATEYCDHTTRYSCSGIGICLPRPSACNRILRPVCSCDKMYYPNECEAHRVGKDVKHEGACDCRDTGCPTNESCQACQGPMMSITYQCIPAGAAC